MSDRVRILAEALAEQFEAAVSDFENRGKGGQQAGDFHGDFRTDRPSMVGRLRWWARELREALATPAAPAVERAGTCPACGRYDAYRVKVEQLRALQERVRALEGALRAVLDKFVKKHDADGTVLFCESCCRFSDDPTGWHTTTEARLEQFMPCILITRTLALPAPAPGGPGKQATCPVCGGRGVYLLDEAGVTKCPRCPPPSPEGAPAERCGATLGGFTCAKPRGHAGSCYFPIETDAEGPHRSERPTPVPNQSQSVPKGAAPGQTGAIVGRTVVSAPGAAVTLTELELTPAASAGLHADVPSLVAPLRCWSCRLEVGATHGPRGECLPCIAQSDPALYQRLTGRPASSPTAAAPGQTGEVERDDGGVHDRIKRKTCDAMGCADMGDDEWFHSTECRRAWMREHTRPPAPPEPTQPAPGDAGEGERAFPVHMGGRPPEAPESVPWRLLAPHEAQALKNHGQTLERLAERGGLCLSEIVAVLEDRKWRPMSGAEALHRLKFFLAAMPGDAQAGKETP